MNLSKKNLVIILVAVAVVVPASIMLFAPDDGQIQKDSEPTPSAQVSSPKPTSAPVTGGTADKTATYTKLVEEYRDRRIQFDAMCQAIPKNATYKNGTKVMFDNRSGDARTITVDGVQHYLSGYGYKIITLSSKTLPKNILLSCGSAINVGQILLQQ